MLFYKILLTLGLLLTLAAPSFPQTPHTGQTKEKGIETQAAIRVDVSVVDVPVSVTGSQGQFITGLTQQNFRVYEDGRLQKISAFDEENIPVSVGLLVDHSGSMAAKLPEVSAAAVAFAQSSNPKDEMFVVDFNDIVSLELPAAAPFTSDVKQLERAVMGVSADGRTALNDAILVALNQLLSSHRERQALIIVSDGGDNASKHKFAQVLSDARASKASIYSIGIFDATEADQNSGVLEKLAKTTGGKAYFPRSVTEVASICKQIARDIREQYTLGYSPSNAALQGSYRKIQVKIDSPNHEKLHVRARAGYLSQPKLTSASPARASGN